MFMMTKKKRKTVITVVAVLVSLMFMLSVVAGYFSTTGYTYSYPQTVNGNSTDTMPAQDNSVPANAAPTGHAVPQQK